MSNEQPASPSVPGGRRSGGSLQEAFRNRGFLACVALLAAMTIGFEITVRLTGTEFNKIAVPLKKDLSELDAERIAPFKLLVPIPIQSDVLNQLGTDKYVQWLIADPYTSDGTIHPTAGSPDSMTRKWSRRMTLFVTYYTGSPDPVPHVPETCHQGSGHDLDKKEDTTVEVSIGGRLEELPIRVLEFKKPGELAEGRRLVIYTFQANGAFYCDRLGVMNALAAGEHAYFSKLELGTDIGQGYRTREEAVEAMERFLKVVVPVLLQDHWPDWEEVLRLHASQVDQNDAKD